MTLYTLKLSIKLLYNKAASVRSQETHLNSICKSVAHVLVKYKLLFSYEYLYWINSKNKNYKSCSTIALLENFYLEKKLNYS